MPTESSRRYKFARWLVIVVSVAGILAAAASLVLIWKTSAGTAMQLPERISETTRTSASLLLLAVTFLIAWRAGDHPPNVALALAFAFAFSNDAFYVLGKELQVNVAIGKAVTLSTFILGAGFYIRAAQRFPRTLTPLDIASSRTMWARIKPMRAVLTFFLHAPAVWLFVISATLLAELPGPPQVSEATPPHNCSIGAYLHLHHVSLGRSGNAKEGLVVLRNGPGLAYHRSSPAGCACCSAWRRLANFTP